MPDIRPVSDLRKDYKGIERAIEETGGPIFLVSNGRPKMVLIGHKKYEELTGEVSSAPADNELGSLADILQNLRMAREMTTAEVAEKAGCSEEVYLAYESGESLPGPDALHGVASALGISDDTLSLFLTPPGREKTTAQKLMGKLLRQIANI